MGDPRLFVALPLDDGTQEALGRVIEGGRDLQAVKWARAGSMHITLLFLGPTPEDRIGPITETLRGLADGTPSFEVVLGGWGGFPERTRPRVLFANVREGADRIGLLAEKVRACSGPLTALGPEAVFRAHVTLGRVREGKDPREAIRYLEGRQGDLRCRFRADRVALMESLLEPQGARYLTRATFSLAG